jgi:hypothetical protein
MKLSGDDWQKIFYIVEQGLVPKVLKDAGSLPSVVQYALLMAIRVVQSVLVEDPALVEHYRKYQVLYKSLPTRYVKGDLGISI